MTEENKNKLEAKDGELPKEDTSPENLVPSEKKFDQEGNEIIEEPEKKETPSKDGKGDGEEPSPKPSDFKAKHKTWEETEKARVELEKGFHTKSTENADLRRKLADYEKPKPTAVVTPDDKISEITQDTIKQIRALPAKFDSQGKETVESMEEREAQSAILWAKANRKVARLEYEDAHNAEKNEKDTASKLYKKATADGLSTDDELDLVGLEYGRTDPSKSTDDRIGDAVDAVKNRVSRLRDGFVKKQQQSKKDQDDLKVLGGGSRNRPTSGGEGKEVSKPSDMSGAMADIKEKRRVKKDDLLSK